VFVTFALSLSIFFFRIFSLFSFSELLSVGFLLNHRYLKNNDYLSFVVCPLIAPSSKEFFAAATNSNNATSKAGGISHYSVYLSLDVYDLN